MTLSIEEIIKKRPHLKEPFRMYEKVLQYIGEVRHLMPLMTGETGLLDRKAYRPETIAPVFTHFLPIFDLPEGSLSPLKEAMEVGDVDFTRLPLREVPAFSLPYAEEELAMLLYLLSRPYFLWLRNSFPMDNLFWDEGRCPVCSAQPVVSSLTKEGHRQVFCSFCGTVGYYRHLGCPACLSKDTFKVDVLKSEGEEGFRIDACDDCGSYLKTVDAGMPSTMTPDIVDLISLPQDFAAQAKKYVRLSPNPIGMRRMI
jgi:FdhE protein